MAYTHSDRLTALDRSFLDLETSSVHMHVGTVAIFEPGPLAGEDGGLDFDRVLEFAEAGLKRVPRLRQKLVRVPLTGDLAWVDDEHFNLLYHVRHTSLPLPGNHRRLKRLAGRIMSEKLDRRKPMWEFWFVEGLQDGNFAVVSKVHHCLVDGIAGVDLLAAFTGSDPEYRSQPSNHRWIPRPAPSPLGLLRKEVMRRAEIPLRMMRQGTRWLQHPRESSNRAIHVVEGVLEALSNTFTPASATPFNLPIGPHRRFDWTHFDLSEMREVGRKLGATLNDVALACVAGAVRNHLSNHDTSLDDIDFRVLIPVSTRSDEERGKLGNRISLVVAPLPVNERDAKRRLERVSAATRRLKRSNQIKGAEMIEALSDWTTSALITEPSRLAASRTTFNMVITNVPGPRQPIYFAGSRLLACYPLGPLFENQGVGIALFSCGNELHWGFNADWDVALDLHDFVLAVEQEFQALRRL